MFISLKERLRLQELEENRDRMICTGQKKKHRIKKNVAKICPKPKDAFASASVLILLYILAPVIFVIFLLQDSFLFLNRLLEGSFLKKSRLSNCLSSSQSVLPNSENSLKRMRNKPKWT